MFAALALSLVAGCGGAQQQQPQAQPRTPSPEVVVPEPESTSSDDTSDEVPGAVAETSAREVFPDGLVIEELAPGSGPEAKAGDRVAVHYDGTLETGGTFDSSRERGTPFVFELGRGHVIQGFERGVLGMRPGGRRLVEIPPQLGYGAKGAGDKIPPNATLIFELELIEFR